MSKTAIWQAETYAINSKTYNLHLDYKGRPLDDEYYRRLAEIEGLIEGYKERRDRVGLFKRVIQGVRKLRNEIRGKT